ncbi:hypothetical protein ACH419_31265 [Streptomyces bobili]|uniref:hypothetical protein n=1 Tax=Streptomyces bobili TaxID=67280 RepID=UPI0037BD6355
MTTSPRPLPDQWTINLHPVANLTILTLKDTDGAQREIGFHPLTRPGTVDRTVGALEEITELELRASAQKLIDTFYERTAQAQANAHAFSATVPDQRSLFDRLRDAIPCDVVRLAIDDETLTLVLQLTATGPAAGTLLNLTARWPGSATADGRAGGVTKHLDDHGKLTVRFDQTRAEAFLTWYRDQPCPPYWTRPSAQECPTAPPSDASTEISADDAQRLITTAVVLYDRYGDGHDVLSSSQVEVVERLRSCADGSSGDELARLSAWDLLSIATTAVELTDLHGIDDQELDAAVQAARVYVEVDDAES